MIKFCVEQWEKNKNRLEEVLKADSTLNACSYKYLVELVVKYVFNNSEDSYSYDNWDYKKITEIDNGDYQGTLLFMIPKQTYQPSEGEYLLTYAGYGSCSGCDTLKAIQSWEDKPPTERQLKDYMSLCKDLACNTVKPYNKGWCYDSLYDEVSF